MKAIIKNFVLRTARNPLAWPLYKTCGHLSDFFGRFYGTAKYARERGALIMEIQTELFPDLTVINGPFKKLRYPSAQSVGSTLLPKLLGTYESELQPTLSRMLDNRYATVVDIGCAEGYYAIGAAMRLPNARVYAFDINPKARQLCAEMARLNCVSDRIHIEGSCTGESLRSIPLGERALIICDCEGYEGSLFTRQVAESLAKHDVIVETHDFIDIELSTKIRDAFAETHHVQSIKSLDDIEKAQICRDPALKHYNTRDKHLILMEERPAIMEWLVMTSKEESLRSRN